MSGALKALGTVGSIAMGTNPLLAVGSTLATSALQNAFAGGSNSPSTGGGSTPQYALPDYNYGTNTYTLGGKPYDASQYFITGDKGVYNLLPMLGDVYQDPNQKDNITGSYNTYQTIYDKMAGDAAAQAAFAKAYGPQTFTYAPPAVNPKGHGGGNLTNAFGVPYSQSMGNGNGYMSAFGLGGIGGSGGRGGNPNMLKNLGLNLGSDARRDLYATLQNQLQAANAYNKPTNGHNKQSNDVLNNSLNLNTGTNTTTNTAATPYTYTPIQYVNWNLNNTANAFADYAAKQNNPFFVPFAPKPAVATTTPTTPAAVTTTPTNNFQTPAKFSAGGIMGLLKN